MPIFMRFMSNKVNCRLKPAFDRILEQGRGRGLKRLLEILVNKKVSSEIGPEAIQRFKLKDEYIRSIPEAQNKIKTLIRKHLIQEISGKVEPIAKRTGLMKIINDTLNINQESSNWHSLNLNKKMALLCILC